MGRTGHPCEGTGGHLRSREVDARNVRPEGMGQKAPGATCAAGKSGPGGVGNEPEAGPETTWHGRSWTLEAGIGVFGSHALSEFRHDAVGVAGWVGVGGEHIRVEVDYWHQQRREEYVESFELFGGTLENRTTELRIKKQYHVLVSRRFAVGRGIVPHVAIGGGYGGNQGYRCHETRGVFEASRVCQRWTADAFVATGAGLDVLLGTRLFARVQTRGLIGAADDHYGTWESVLRAAMAWVVVTGGVRF